jgi:hypothetical protein
MHVDMRIAESDWNRLRRHFASSFQRPMAPETGALAILGQCKTSGRHEFIVAKVLFPGGGEDLKESSGGALVFGASFVRRAHLEMRKNGLVGLATFHTHPGSDRHVGFSPYDDQQDPLLVENLLDLEPRTRLISVVAGAQSQCGRFFTAPRCQHPLRNLIVVGERLLHLPLKGEPPPAPPPVAAIFDRGLALTGSGALSMLSQLTVAVVGASGTGSLVCELLARAGCRRILLIDDDLVWEVNLNRILYATASDARRGVPKVEVLRRGIEGLGLGCRVEAICGSILDEQILARVRDADVVFGCVDRALPRHLLCELSFRYLLPYIDVGSEIGADSAGIVSLDSRVSYVAPGRSCLTCSGVVTARALRFESLTKNEREREIAQGYSDDLVMRQPAVMELNMRAASNGVLLLRHLLQPFLREPLPVTLMENAVTYRINPVSVARTGNQYCQTCQQNSQFGYGDCGRRVGFDRETAKQLAGSDGRVSEGVADGILLRASRLIWRLLLGR